MNSKKIYYSCYTWLSFKINKSYYNDSHYVWCTPYFDPTSRYNQSNEVPETSSPHARCHALNQAIAVGLLDVPPILQNKAGILRGAQLHLERGIITAAEHADIIAIVHSAEIVDFRPLLFVIPAHAVENSIKSIAIGEGGRRFSEEFIIENLQRHQFDVIEFNFMRMI